MLKKISKHTEIIIMCELGMIIGVLLAISSKL